MRETLIGMKKIAAIFAGLIGLAVVLLVLSSRNGLSLGGAVVAASPDAKQLETMSKKFLEDIQFKDFEKAASYHSREDRKKVDIPRLIERMFGIKHETLDIMRFEVVKVQIDSTGQRARVKTKTVVKVLNTSEIKEPEVMLYYFKDPAEGWVMDLESSLQ